MSAQREQVAHPYRDVQVSEAHRALTVQAEMLRCLLPQFDQVSITVVDSTGAVSTWAQAGDLASDLDRLQYALGEGPCFDTLTRAAPVVAAYIHLEEVRWRRYVPAAAQLGLRSQVSAPLIEQDDRISGAVNLYSTSEPRVGVTVPLVAVALARQAAGTLAILQEVEGLHRALIHCTIIGQATGLVMGRFDLASGQALDYLGRVSMDRHVDIGAVAAEIVNTREFPVVGAG